MSIPDEIGSNIVSLRKKKGLSQEDLAFYSGMSVSYLRAIEHGDANPTINALSRLADTLEETFSTVVHLHEQEKGKTV